MPPHPSRAASLLLTGALVAAAVAAVVDGGAAAGDVDALGQQYPPGAVEAAFAEAAATVPSLGPEMREALRAAVADTVVDAHDLPLAARTNAAGLAPWEGQEAVAAPQAPQQLVTAWPPSEREPGNVAGVPTALAVSASRAAAAQAVPPEPAPNECCAALVRAGFRSNLPVVVVDTGGPVVVPVRRNVRAKMCTCGAEEAARGGGANYEGYIAIKARGSSSAVQMVKKQLGIKLSWAEGEGEGEREGEAGREGEGGRRLLTAPEQQVPPREQDLEVHEQQQQKQKQQLQQQQRLQMQQAGEGGGEGLGEEEEEEEDEANSNSRSTLPRLGKKRKAGLMGMPPGSHWVLWGGDGDATLGMRNALAYDAARATGSQWAPRTQNCELFLIEDGQPLSVRHYYGTTLLLERIKRGSQRVDVRKLKPNKDLSGGYIWGYERNLWPKDVRFTPGREQGDGRGLTYTMHYPDLDGAAEAFHAGTLGGGNLRVLTWAGSFMAAVEAALVRGQAPGGTPDPPDRPWRALVDEDAFIDYLLVTELTKNPDGFRGSIYMHKDKGGPLRLGPVWDYNEAYGMCCGYPIAGHENQGISNGTSGGSAISPSGFRFNICDEAPRCVEDPVDGISLWWRQAWRREPAFRVSVARRWQQHRVGALSDSWFFSRLQAYQQELAFAAPRNFVRWAAVHASPYYASPYDKYRWSVRTMGEWLHARLAWLDAAFARAQAEAQAAPGGAPSSAALSGEEAQRVMGAAVAQADAAAARVGREEGGGRASGLLEGAGGGGVQERLAALRAAALG